MYQLKINYKIMTETQNTNTINIWSLVRKELPSFATEIDNFTKENLEYVLSILKIWKDNPSSFCAKYNKKNIPITQMMFKVVAALSKFNKKVDNILLEKRS